MLDSRFDFTPRNCAGFTLVELLVVVLILCILVSVALPVYNRVIAKTRASQLLIAMNSVLKGEEVYFINHNKYAMDIGVLNIHFPNLPKKNVNHISGGSNIGYGPAYGPNMWAIYTHTPKGDVTLNARFDSGLYWGCGFWYGFEFSINPKMEHKIFCFEGERNKQIKPGDFCKTVMGAEELVYTSSGGSRWYAMPD